MKGVLKSAIVGCLILCGIRTLAQNKYDANWCFGIGAGIDFNDTINPQVFQSKANNLEVAASISDSSGRLQLYLDANGRSYTLGRILDNSNNVIINGDSINTEISCTNGALFIPLTMQDNYMLFHIGWQVIFPYYTYRLCYTKIKRNDSGEFGVYRKNIQVFSEPVEEKLTGVRHANGKDWWILVRRLSESISSTCNNRFYKFLLTSDSLEGPFIQDIGGLHCSTASDQGEITFSKQGDKVAVIYQYDGKFDLFDFDRCTGLLSNFNEIVANNPYGAEFSPDGRLLYVSEGANGFGGVFQYDLTTSDISSTRLPVWINTDSNVYVGQLELAPNKKIYLSSVEGQFNFPVNFPFDSINQHLGVINFPDQIGVACNFQPFSFYLGDSARSLVGLPNMPNYNLGPTSVYLADAGKDTVYCSNLSNGTTIGVPPVANIIYSWTPSRGLSDTTIAQPPD